MNSTVKHVFYKRGINNRSINIRIINKLIFIDCILSDVYDSEGNFIDFGDKFRIYFNEDEVWHFLVERKPNSVMESKSFFTDKKCYIKINKNGRVYINDILLEEDEVKALID